MSHVFRFLATQTDARTWQLVGDEAHHLVKVLRLAAGAAVEVTDGRGAWALGAVRSADAREVVVDVAQAGLEPAPAVRLALAVGALKPSDVDDVLPALVELGVDTVHVFLQEESAKARLTDKVVERWERILRAATKQSKRAWLPTLVAHRSLAALVAALADGGVPGAGDAGGDQVRLVLDGAAPATMSAALARLAPGATSILALAGGEKGLTPAELTALAAAGFTPVRLGPFVLRAVTAVLAAATALSLCRADLAPLPIPSGRPPC